MKRLAVLISAALVGLSPGIATGDTALIVGGAGNNLGALVGAVVVWGLWSASSAAVAAIFPPEQQARAASLEIVMIGVLLALILVVMPRGLLGERITVSRFVKRRDGVR